MSFRSAALSRNVGRATVKLVFTDSSTEQIEIPGEWNSPAKWQALEYMNNLPRNGYKSYSNDNKKITFKDVQSVEIIDIQDDWMEIEV